MRALFSALAAFTATLLLNGCGTDSVYGVSNGIRFAYPTIGFDGRYSKQLTVDDVRQIVLLARSNRKIVKPVQQIIMDKPDEAEVRSGPMEAVSIGTTFNVRKKNGHWIIIEQSINTGETITTG